MWLPNWLAPVCLLLLTQVICHLVTFKYEPRRKITGLQGCEQQRHRPTCASTQTDQCLLSFAFWKGSFLNLLQVKFSFLCPQRNFGRHIVIALSVRPSVRQSVRPSVRQSVRPSRFRVRSISPIFFEVGIPNLVCGYILGWRSVAYHFRVTVTLTLTSDLVFRIIVSGAYLLYYLR